MTDLAFNMSDHAKATVIPKFLRTVQLGGGYRTLTGITRGHNMIHKSFSF